MRDLRQSEKALRELLSEPLAAGRIVYHRGYEDVHEENVRAVVGPSAGSS